MKKIFVSRPNSYDPMYKSTVIRLEKIIRDRGMEPVTIGSTYFPNESPVLAIKNKMKECAGIIILALPQIYVEKGISKKGSPSETSITAKQYPSPWNQIEGTMAYMLDLPMMIIAEEGINDGLLENGTLPVFKNEYNLRSYHWIEKQNFLEPFNEWCVKL